MPLPSSLLCLVCGFERGGTTTLSELLRQAPGVEAGFEGGFLLASSPAEFPSVEPYYGMALRGWGLALEDMEYLCTAPGWEEMYRRLAQRFRPDEAVRVFDKTPRYMESLAEVMAKVPGVPVIVVVRDPRALFWSWAKRADERPGDWIEVYAGRYRSYAAGYAAAVEAGLSRRILLVRHEDFSLHPEEEGRRVFDFLGLDFDPAYLSFEPRFRNVRGEAVTSAFVVEYREHLSTEECARIRRATADWPEWWWDPPEGFTPAEAPVARAGPGPVAARSKEERRRRRRVAAAGRGGPECFADRVAALGLRPLDAVLDLATLPGSGRERLAAAVEKGRYRRVDWEARLRSGGPRRPMGGPGGRFDVVLAHSVLPFLAPDEASLLFADVAAVLAPSGRLFATAYVDDSGEHAHRPMPHGSGRSFPGRPPFHIDGGALRSRALAAGLEVAAVEAIGHPSGQHLVVLRALSPRG